MAEEEVDDGGGCETDEELERDVHALREALSTGEEAANGKPQCKNDDETYCRRGFETHEEFSTVV